MHEQGACLLFDLIKDEHEQLARLQRVSLSDWRKERERMLAHFAQFTADRRFRQQPEKYLAELEARAGPARAEMTSVMFCGLHLVHLLDKQNKSCYYTDRLINLLVK